MLTLLRLPCFRSRPARIPEPWRCHRYARSSDMLIFFPGAAPARQWSTGSMLKANVLYVAVYKPLQHRFLFGWPRLRLNPFPALTTKPAVMLALSTAVPSSTPLRPCG